MTTRRIGVTVDGVRYSDDVEPRTLLVHYLRETLGKTGTVVGCDTSNCGVCTVHLDGRSVKSCSVLAVQADGDFPAKGPLALESGDILLLVTDGVLEAAAPDGQRFGTQRTLELVRANRRRPASEIVRGLYQEVRAFARPGDPADDVTAVAIKVGSST